MRTRRSGLGLGLALMVATTAGCGASGGGSVDAGPTPTRPSTTAGGSTGTTIPGSPDTTQPGGTTEVVVYFTRGEKITPITRAVPKVTRIGAEAVKALVDGPTAGETASGLGTAIPAETRFRGLVIADGVAKVDLSNDFESGGGSLSLSLRLAQVTCTLDEFPSVSGVRFLLDGQLVDVFSGNGIVLDQPVSCADYAEFRDDGSVTASFPGIWPFATQAELDAYQGGTDQTFRRADVTAREFGIRYLGMVNPAVIGSPTPVGGGRVEVGLGFLTGENGIPIADPKPTTSVFLISGGADGDQGAWTVVGASSPQIVVTQPAALDRISSPVAVRGQAATFEGNVLVEVRQDGMLTGANLGFAPVTGRGDGVLGGFSGDITFSSPTKTGGAVVFSEHSALDNSGVVRASVVKVAF